MERIEYLIWLLIVFMIGVTLGLYWGGVTAKRQLKEVMFTKDHFVTQRLSE